MLPVKSPILNRISPLLDGEYVFDYKGISNRSWIKAPFAERQYFITMYQSMNFFYKFCQNDNIEDQRLNNFILTQKILP